MKTVKEITIKLFSINFEKDLEDEKVSDEYETIAQDLIENNKWLDVYTCWYDYLITNCKTEEDALNFANLFWFYEGYKQFIPNAIEFCAFFYANISFDNHPEAISVVDGIAWNALLNAGIISEFELPFEEYAPVDIPEINEYINKWEEKGYRLR